MKNDWEKMAANIIKAELAIRGFNYEDLRIRLEKLGVEKSVHNLTKTINMGKFPFAFFLQCAAALNMKSLRLDQLPIHEAE